MIFEGVLITMDDIYRFWSMVASGDEDDCWPWTGYRMPRSGHGQIAIGSQRDGTSRRVLAHRLGWFLQYGNIPQGLNVLHHCDFGPCVNGRHLFVGTQLDNIHDATAKGRVSQGDEHCHAKLSKKRVEQIRRELAAGLRSQRAIAVDYEVHPSQVSRIATGAAWRSV